jgi:sacsin
MFQRCECISNADTAQLKEIQVRLAGKGKLSDNDLKVYISLLEVLRTLHGKIDYKKWKAPDVEGVLHDLANLTAGDPSHDDDDDMAVPSFAYLHPAITPRTIKYLKIPSIQDRFLDQKVGAEFGMDFAQDEDPINAISDTLQRYPFQSTFNEYLANAEDSGARKICWLIDRTESYPNSSLMTTQLQECAGPALLCFNDGGP